MLYPSKFRQLRRDSRIHVEMGVRWSLLQEGETPATVRYMCSVEQEVQYREAGNRDLHKQRLPTNGFSINAPRLLKGTCL